MSFGKKPGAVKLVAPKIPNSLINNQFLKVVRKVSMWTQGHLESTNLVWEMAILSLPELKTY